MATAAWANAVKANFDAGANALVTTAGDMLYATGANALARLPIGSTGQVLRVSGGLPVWGAPAMVRAWNASTIAIASGGTYTTFTMDSEDYDTDTMHSTASNTDRIVFTTAGTYLVAAHVVINGSGAGDMGARILLNAGATVIHSTGLRGGASGYKFDVVLVRAFVAADYISCGFSQSSGGGLSILGAASSDDASYVSATRLA